MRIIKCRKSYLVMMNEAPQEKNLVSEAFLQENAHLARPGVYSIPKDKFRSRLKNLKKKGLV